MKANLISCPACERQISPEAASCPACGQPIRAAENHEAFAGKIIVVVLLVLAGIGFLAWTIHKINTDARDAAVETQMLNDK
jgi:predicted amidophosphoribosyltransferase